MTTPTSTAITKIQQKIWEGSLPLEIRLSSSDSRIFDETEAYLISVPRLSYLPFLLPRLHAFFSPSLIDPKAVAAHEAWLSYENVPLKWHYPLGLLFDLFSGSQPADLDQEQEQRQQQQQSEQLEETLFLPWRLTLHYTEFPVEQLIPLDKDGKVLLDAYINGVKEADVIRNGKGNVFMGLSKDDSDALWNSVLTHNLTRFNAVNNKLLNPPGLALRNIPIKIYLPTAPEHSPVTASGTTPQGSIRTVQSLVPALSDTRQPNTLGTALHKILPTVFPSRRNPVLANPVMHGAVLPMNAPVEELMRAASYADGFLHIAVIMLS